MKTEALGATPSNNFLVGRMKRHLLRNSWIGALVTSRDSALSGDYNRVYGADAHFQFFQKLDVDSYLLRSDTPGRSGDNRASRLQTGWRDEEFSASAEYNSAQPNFNPEVGFIRRRDMEQYAGDVAWRPLFRTSDLVRNLTIGTALDYFAGSGSGTVETRVSDTTFGVLFQNNASINVIVNRTFDRLHAPLRIPSGNPRVTIGAGDYTFESYTGNFTTNTRRKVSGSGAYTAGDFYDGDRRQLTAALTLKPTYHATINLTYDRSHVALPNGAFTTQLVGAKFIYAFTPRAFVNAFIQYNADTHLVSSNLRFDLIHHPLSDLYIVYNDTRDTVGAQLRERALIVKLTNLFNF
jgi:hypothetical protein